MHTKVNRDDREAEAGALLRSLTVKAQNNEGLD